MSNAAVAHPLLLLSVQLLSTVLILSFSAPKSWLRPAFFVAASVVLARAIPASYTFHVQSLTIRNLIAAEAVGRLLHFFDVGIVTQWSYEADGPEWPNPYIQYNDKKAALTVSRRNQASTKARSGGRTGESSHQLWDRLRFGIYATFHHRNCGTRLETKNVPSFSAKDSKYVPSRTTFIVRTSIRAVVCYLLMDLMTSNPPTDNAVLFAADRVPLLKRLRSGIFEQEELGIRAGVSIGTLLSIYLMVNWMRSTIAVIGVAFGWSQPENWKPMWGSLRETYTVRGFWGSFWQQINRQRFSSPTSWVTYHVLGLRKGSLTGRYLSIFLVFVLSGYVHAAAEIASGRPRAESHAVRYFLMQYYGIVFEDAVEAVARRCGIAHGAQGPSIVWKTVGYVWVLLFQIWTVPCWVYPELRSKTGGPEEAVLPFSIARWLKSSS